MSAWPPLPYDEWKGTLYALHRWTQIVGKIRFANTPLLPHLWNSTLSVGPFGLTTGLVPARPGAFQIDLDLLHHTLRVATSTGGHAAVPLRAMSVARFFRELLEALESVGVPDPHISRTPNEVAQAIRFDRDTEVRPYDREQAQRFAGALLETALVFERFRAGFLGKASPVQFFWGAPDLAVERFSGRRAPAYAGLVPPHVHPHVMHEAYSHELTSAGFWSGSDDAPRAEYYAYAMPAPQGLDRARIEPAAAGWDAARGEFLLPYDAVRLSPDPAATLTAFLESTYAVAADLARWDRALLEDSVACACEPIPRALRRRSRPTNDGRAFSPSPERAVDGDLAQGPLERGELAVGEAREEELSDAAHVDR